MFFETELPKQGSLRAAITHAYHMDETDCVKYLLQTLEFTPAIEKQIHTLAIELVNNMRKSDAEKGAVETLMTHYDLSTEEGVLLMCLAEALLRIPDTYTEKLLIQDKLTSADWNKHLGIGESSFVNLTTRGLSLGQKILGKDEGKSHFKKLWYGLLKRAGEPFIRAAVREAVKMMSKHFVLGRTINEALDKSKPYQKMGYCFSYDMLGEVALTQDDADKYFAAYEQAIAAIGSSKRETHDIFQGPGISVKLSALYPRYDANSWEKAIPFLKQRLKTLALQAKAANMSLTVDAEESYRLDMSLSIIRSVFADPDLADWQGLGLAVQTYQKRAMPLLHWLIHIGKKYNKRIQVRLVKGAYWDTEIKLAQVNGYPGYPVFTRKMSTDVSYLACAKLALSAQGHIYPQFATHNAYTVAAILNMMDDPSQYQFEFQNLQGMGKSLHHQLVGPKGRNIPCRIYAPVGNHKELLPYLVRRLLENGANSSFINQVANKEVSAEALVKSPVEFVQSLHHIPHPKIPLPAAIYGKRRINSRGIDFSNSDELHKLTAQMQTFYAHEWNPQNVDEKKLEPVFSPTDHRRVVGHYIKASKEDAQAALARASAAYPAWADLPITERADKLLVMAELLEHHRAELMALVTREAGKTQGDAIAEVREAIDFCRYYAMQAKRSLKPQELIGPTGESNTLSMRGRGVILCISPWNFPLAIFIGQVVAALVAGNTVLAKPALNTPLIARRAVELLHEAGVPNDVVQFVPGRGEVVGNALVADERVSGVMLTGSTSTAKSINLALANRKGPIVPFIAETGGMNTMIVDSSALPEQVVKDILESAFMSAGQRCSALRAVFVQDVVADRIIEMLKGAMQELVVGDPQYLSTDVGPVIDDTAKGELQKHVDRMRAEAKLIYACDAPSLDSFGSYIVPQAYELNDLSQLHHENFGPILHVLRYNAKELDKVIDSVNALGYGLTFGIQSRIDETAQHIEKHICVGNVYVNRNMIGAVVGVQPFGGQGLSGTGPKAGGPHYLLRLCTETTVSINTAAVGGNATLMSLKD